MTPVLEREGDVIAVLTDLDQSKDDAIKRDLHCLPALGRPDD
jgi:hypothetical protein